MHWVYATDPSGKKIPVNLAAIPTMLRSIVKDGEVEKPVTILFLGGIAVSIQGGITYAQTQVLETPDELFALKPIEAGPKPLHPAFTQFTEGPALKDGDLVKMPDGSTRELSVVAPKRRKATRK